MDTSGNIFIFILGVSLQIYETAKYEPAKCERWLSTSISYVLLPVVFPLQKGEPCKQMSLTF